MVYIVAFIILSVCAFMQIYILNKFMDRYNDMSPKVKGLTEKMISIPQVEERRYMLEKEFLDPYVIDNAEKSE